MVATATSRRTDLFIADGKRSVARYHNRTGETVNGIDRSQLARRALDGYASGPAASTQPTTQALARVGRARALVLVEGISDQIAVETAAVERGRDLQAEGVV